MTRMLAHTLFADDKPLLYGFLGIMAWLPLPLASHRPWAWSLMQLLVLLLAMCWCLLWWRNRVSITETSKRAWPALLFLGAWLLYLTMYLIPMPYALVAALSPVAAQIHAEMYITGKPYWASLSLDPHASWVFFLKSLSYASLFFLALQLISDRHRIRLLIWVLVYSALFQAVYGGLMTLSGLEYGFFFEKYAYRDVATGTFVNRNHMANYLVLCLAMGIGLMIADLGGEKASNWRQWLRGWVRLLLSPKARLRIMLAVLVIGLILTRSRMGNSAFFISMTLSALLAIVLSRRLPRSLLILFVSFILIDTFLLGAYFGVDRVVQRISSTSAEMETRDEVNQYSFNYWQDYKIFGSGAGTFYVTFPHYRGHDVHHYYDHAHNDYAQIASETGLMGFGLLGGFVLSSFWAAIRAQSLRGDPLMKGLSFAVIMSVLALVIHSAVDFSLQIPANAGTFVVILAMAWVALTVSRHHRHRSKKRRRRSRSRSSSSEAVLRSEP